MVYALIGLMLVGGGVWLFALGGSAFYLAVGLGILVTGGLLADSRSGAMGLCGRSDRHADLGGRRSRLRLVAARGARRRPFSARAVAAHAVGDSQSRSRHRRRDAAVTLPLWVAVVAGAVVLVIGLRPTITTSTARSLPPKPRPRAEAATQPVDDWRDYGRTQFGQRYSPLRQITPANAKTLKVAWTFRTGDLPGQNDPVETTFEVTPIKVRDTLYLCSQHQRLFALDAKTGALRWSYDPKVEDNPTFQHLTCRGVSYHETARRRANADGAPAPTDCPRTIFLPVNDGRMIALNADTGKPCESFADHGTLDLQEGMGVKTAGFYEPTSPPMVSDKIIVVAGAVIDNYSTEEPSGVIRGFDIHTGKLVWAWDSGAADENALPSPRITYTNNSPNSWMTASYDAKLGLVYLPMGVQTPDIWGGNRGARPSAIRARWWRSTSTPASASGPIRPCITISGTWICRRSRPWSICRPRSGIVPAIIQPAKTGNLFVLDRRTGEPIVPAPERPVRKAPRPATTFRRRSRSPS